MLHLGACPGSRVGAAPREEGKMEALRTFSVGAERTQGREPEAEGGDAGSEQGGGLGGRARENEE